MVDCFTQWLMKPLHTAIFELLAQIPQDGTFDQLRPVKSMMRRRWAKAQGMWSYDLSAATDRLPIVIQKVLLSPFLTSWGAEVWASLLIGRPYYFAGLSNKSSKGLPAMDGRDLYYSRGQPMGALSSWAMLAFTHHALVQWAAARSVCKDKPEWFADYAVLGDDIVIGDKAVAREYLAIMDSLGVQISIHKSLVSARRPVCEFAKRFFSKTEDLSGVPWREALLAPQYFAVLMDVIRHYKPRLGIIFHFLGYGYRVRGSLTAPFFKQGPRVRNVLLSLLAPGGPFQRPVSEFFRLRSVGTTYASKGRWPRVVEDYLGAMITAFRQSLDALDSLRDQVKTLVAVYRDREHYGTLGFAGERIPVTAVVAGSIPSNRIIIANWSEGDPEIYSPDPLVYAKAAGLDISYLPAQGSVSSENLILLTGREAYKSVSETTLNPRIAESIRETVYREAFLDVIIELRDVRVELDQLAEDWKSGSLSTMDGFVHLWDRINGLQESVEALPLPRSLEMRKKDAVTRSRLLSLVRKWYTFSKPFRSTT
jgi:hypothetical protein